MLQRKQLKDGCMKDKCKFKCQEKVDKDTREMLFKNFWETGDINKQRQFITKTVDKVNTKRTYTKGGSRRQFPYCYSFLINDTKVKVSKKMYTETLAIKQDIVFGTFKKQNKFGAIEDDRREGSRSSLKTKKNLSC